MKLRLFLITTILLAVGGLAATWIWQRINFVPSAQAVGDLTINWGVPSGQPIFSVSNFLPSDSESRTVTITNAASGNRQLGMRIDNVIDTATLSSQIKLTVRENGSTIFNTTKTLEDLINETVPPGFLQFAVMPPSTVSTYEFIAAFNPYAGDEYQNTFVQFDIIIGIAFDLPSRCQDTDFSNGQVIFGTAGRDNLSGTPGNDIILGFEGDDHIQGNNGDDCILGGPGNDRLNGNNGADVIFGGEGDDKLYGNNQNDYLDGELGNDRAEGNAGSDTCIAETTFHCETVNGIVLPAIAPSSTPKPTKAPKR